MEYKGILKERQNWLTILFVILAALMLWRTVATEHWSYIPIVILVILACFFRKEQIVSEEGVNIRYILFGRFIMNNLWGWEEITSIQTNYRKAAPNVQVLIARDVVIRPFIVTRQDANGIQALSERMNPRIQMNEYV